MVVVGDYSVRLVNAETKEPFKEHVGPDGKFYAEVEPDLEYFIEIEVVGDNKEIAVFEFTVDGQKLDYICPAHRTHGKLHRGIWFFENGADTMQALALKRPTFTDSDGCTRSGSLIGDVKIDIYKGVSQGTYTLTNYSSASLKEASVRSGLAHAQTKKVLRSTEGSVSETKASNPVRTRYGRGEHLHTITIHYCTALGLVNAGLFGKVTDICEKQRIIEPRKRPENDVKLQPKRVKVGGVVENGVKLEAPKEVEEFDLTDE